MWETSIQPFLVRYALVLALLFTVIGAARIISTYNQLATTADEPAHIACGLQYLTKHVYYLETQHPPLTRVMIALLPYLSGTRTRGKKNFQLEGWSDILYEKHPQLTVWRMRLGNLPFFLLGCAVVFLWARRYFGAACGVIALACFTMIPTVLAHAGLATTDMGLASCLGAAFLAMLVWVEEPTYKHGAIFGFCLALALLSKFTTLGFFPLGAAIAFLFFLSSARPGIAGLKRLARERLASFGIAAAVCFFVWWASYLFTFGKVPFWNVYLPAWEYFDGIRVALLHNTEGHPAYLLGKASRFGWWYYFPVGLTVKTPLAMLLLVIVGAIVSWNQRARLPYLLPFAFMLGILLPAMGGNVNIGMRHVLPVYIGFAIVAAVGAEYLLRVSNARAWAGPLAGVLMLWLAATGALHHPDYIPYFNELVSYPQDRVLCDSDYDWGQDTARLAARLRELGATEVNYGPLIADDQVFLEAYSGLPHIVPIHPTKPAEGWTAICPTPAHTSQYGLQYRYPNLKPWYEYVPVKERVGTIDLLYLPPGTLK